VAKNSFEESLERLENITNQLEEGELSLDESLKIFEEGVKLSRLCEQKLTEVEHKLEILKSTDIPDSEDSHENIDQNPFKEDENVEKSTKTDKKKQKPKVTSVEDDEDDNLLF
jgi:exodeoxyribonuclease VII small subunit